MDIIPSTSPKSLTSDTTFSNSLLIVDAYSNIPKLYGMENISTEEVMDKLDMSQSKSIKIDEFGWWDLEIISAAAFQRAKGREIFEIQTGNSILKFLARGGVRYLCLNNINSSKRAHFLSDPTKWVGRRPFSALKF